MACDVMDQILLISQNATLTRLLRQAHDASTQTLTVVETIAGIAPADREIWQLIVCDSADFHEAHDAFERIPILVFAQHAGSDESIEAIKGGAYDSFTRLTEMGALRRQIAQAIRVGHDLRAPVVYDPPTERRDVDQIVGQSPLMNEVYKLIGLIAPREINVLITGESGTGKELVARAILHHSVRRDQPYLAVNCAAIPETLLESELFGHEKGAFTGADARRIGKFEQCDGGTLFLDEIGDIPLSTQAKLLRVLQDRSFQRLGGMETVQCDVRIIAATHQPLPELIARREFREDLYYRLKVASIHLPALREREVDVVLLAHHFVERYNQEFGTDIRAFSPEALPVLLAYPWPGNVRELENAIKAALVVARGTVFRTEFLPESIRAWTAPRPPAAAPSDAPAPVVSTIRHELEALLESAEAGRFHAAAVALIEREAICLALERSGGRLSPAARLLGISRTTLRARIETLGITVGVSAS